MMQKSNRRPGRPARKPNEGERVGLSLRVTPQMKIWLEEAVIRSGRSLSQEAEMLMASAFRDAPLLPQLLDLRCDRQGAGLVWLIVETLHELVPQGATLTETLGANWTEQPWIRQQVREAIVALLEGLLGTDTAPTPRLVENMSEPHRTTARALGREYAAVTLRDLLMDPEKNPDLKRRYGPAYERLASPIPRRKEASNAR